MSFLFGGGGNETPYQRPKKPFGEKLVNNVKTNTAPGGEIPSPYSMGTSELSNYRALQVRKIYEGLGASGKLGG